MGQLAVPISSITLDYTQLAPRRVVPARVRYSSSAQECSFGTAQRRRRATILAAARGMIADKGFEGVSMRELAVSSGVTTPTIYNLVGERNEVIFSALQEALAVKVAFSDALATNYGINRVMLLADACWGSLAQDPAYSRSVLSAMLNGHSEYQSVASRVMAIPEGVITRWIDRMEREQRLRPDRAHLKSTAPNVICQFMKHSICEWAAYGKKSGDLRLHLARGVSIALLSIVNDAEADSISSWTEHLQCIVASGERIFCENVSVA